MEPIDQLLNSGILKSIRQKSQQLVYLNQLVQTVLDNELKPHCQVANYEKGMLTLATDNAAFATQLRYQTPELIKILQQQSPFKDLKNIRYYIAGI